MNKELITKLMLSAAAYALGKTKDHPSQYESVFMGRYTELVVQECAKFAEQYIDERCNRDFIVGVKLKEHFGVEE